MPQQDSVNDRIRRIVAASIGPTGMAPADEAVLNSLLHALKDNEVEPVLTEFFDVQPIVLEIYSEFVDRGKQWNATIRAKLTEALIFHGLDVEADTVQATL